MEGLWTPTIFFQLMVPAVERVPFLSLHLRAHVDAADARNGVIEHGVDDLARNARVLHSGRCRAAQIVKGPVFNATGLVEPQLELRKAGELAGAAAENERIAVLGRADQFERECGKRHRMGAILLLSA